VKALLRWEPVQAALALVLGAYLWLVEHTLRWRRINREAVDEQLKRPGGVLACFWHGRIALSIGGRPVALPHRPTRLMISLSADGEFIARAMAMHGFLMIRGSSRRTSDPSRIGSGSAAYRRSLQWVEEEGGVLVLTPDGPRGPAEEMAEGLVRIAAHTGAPLFLMGFAANPVITLKSWDSMVLPLPFGRAALVFDGPFHAPKDADKATIAKLRRDWAQRLSAATRAAEEAVR
jgi:lysophospholipid acyltransferase (LPLAT)-like uncharacterized protein